MNIKELRRKPWFAPIESYTLIILGSLFVAFGMRFILIPLRLTPGGVTGLSIMGEVFFSIPSPFTMITLNALLLLLSVRYLRRQFVQRTAITILFISAFLYFFTYIQELNSTLINALLKSVEEDTLLNVIFSALIMGTGLGLIFQQESSTGGSEILSRLVQRIFPWMSVPQLLFIFDSIVVLGGMFLAASLKVGLYSLLNILLTTRVMEAILLGLNYSKAVLIICDEPESIARRITCELNRGVTLLSGQGYYTGQDKKILLCAVRYREFPKLRNIVADADPKAFLISMTANQILGYGFRPYKP